MDGLDEIQRGFERDQREFSKSLSLSPLRSIKPKRKPSRQSVGRSQKNAVKIKQKGRCKDCHKVLIVEEYHHIKHVANRGKSTTKNLVALCPECHRKRHIKEKALKLDNKRKKDIGRLGNPFNLGF